MKNFHPLKIQLIIVLSLLVFLSVFPFKVLAGNCCEILKTESKTDGKTTTSNSCFAGDDVVDKSCTSKNATGVIEKATFVKDAVCKQNKCVSGEQANSSKAKKEKLSPLSFRFNIPLPQMDSVLEVSTSIFSNYISWLFKFTVGVSGLLAVFMITIGGLFWVFAGGNSSSISKAKEYITGAVAGLLLAFFSYSILYIINPQMVLNQFPILNSVGSTNLDPATSDRFKGNSVTVSVPKNTVSSGTNNSFFAGITESSQNDMTLITVEREDKTCFYKEFGKTEKEVEKQLVTVKCPFLRQGTVMVHKKVKAAFEKACNNIKRGTKTVCGTIPIMSQSFAWRGKAQDPNSRSLHSWGIALDISTQDCTSIAETMEVPKGWFKKGNVPIDFTPKAKGHPNLPREIINAFKNAGFVWGGDWDVTNPPDNMHFETYGPCAVPKAGSLLGTSGSCIISGFPIFGPGSGGEVCSIGNGSVGTGGSGGQCSGSIVNIPGVIKEGPKIDKVTTKDWKFKTVGGHVYNYQVDNNGLTNIDTTLVIFFHGLLGADSFQGNCDTALREVGEVGVKKYALACVKGESGSPWAYNKKDDTKNVTYKFKEIVNQYKLETGNYNPTIIVAGHSNGYKAMNQLIKSELDSQISKYIWLDACYANPENSSKVVGIETTTTSKTNAPCKCSSIENRYRGGIDHMKSRWALSDYLEAIN